MSKKDDEFRKRLLSTFRIEAEEHLNALSSGLIELEKDLSAEVKGSVIEMVYREAHSLKGAARSVSMTDVQTICQSLETVFSAVKHAEMDLYPELFDLLHKAVNALNEVIFSQGPDGTGSGKENVAEIQGLLAGIKTGESGRSLAPAANHEEPSASMPIPSGPTEVTAPPRATPDQHLWQPSGPEEMVRISSQKMKAVLLQAEEAVSVKLASLQCVNDVREIHSLFNSWGREWSRRYLSAGDLRRAQRNRKGSAADSRSSQQTAKLVEFIDWTQTWMKVMEGRLAELKRRADRDSFSTGVAIDSLLEDVKRTLMLPFSTLFEPLPKLIRDLSREKGKETELVVSGEAIEIDRRILEELRIPLSHLIRNSVDHGIEKPEERIRQGKRGAGTITITVSRTEGNRVEILFSDDGQGIDTQKVKETAIKLGILRADEKETISEKALLPFIFQSGVSTSPIITDTSGRGLGLAIVQEKAEKLGGHVSVESASGTGTSFSIVIPVAISTFRGVLVKASAFTFVLPSSGVCRVVRVKQDDVRKVENRDTIPFEGIAVPIERLSRILELPCTEPEPAFMQVAILDGPGKRIGFVVDEVLGEEELLLKNIGQNISRIRNVTGAAILGSGKVVPVLNVLDLMKSAMKYGATPCRGPLQPRSPEKKKAILVVEDSITSRTLIKNILESAGHLVKTAVDGIDALTLLKTESFDLVVSDVDMPRMNGFDLTLKIRTDQKLAELPVVLVTALDSIADRERGIDVGASAYIVKSSFDQSNLLEVVRRLL
jgi:two-component system, chemotaxis family, sensor kinase CheA